MAFSGNNRLYDPYSAVAFGVLFLLFLIGILIQSTVYLNHDVGWVLRTASWMLQGKEFGRDIVDPSPPLIWYLSLPPALAASFTGLSEPTAFRLFAFLLVAAVLAICWRLLRPFRLEGFRLATVRSSFRSLLSSSCGPDVISDNGSILRSYWGCPTCYWWRGSSGGTHFRDGCRSLSVCLQGWHLPSNRTFCSCRSVLKSTNLP